MNVDPALPADFQDSAESANLSESSEAVRQPSFYQEFLAERQEILTHKWYKSQELGYDIGFEAALLDWIPKHRPEWRASRRPCSNSA